MSTKATAKAHTFDNGNGNDDDDNDDSCPTCSSRRWTNNFDGNNRCLTCGFLRPRPSNDGLNDDEGEYVATVGRRTTKKPVKSVLQQHGHDGPDGGPSSRRKRRFFDGVERNRFHVLAHQLILRRQVWVLVREMGVMAELEEVVRSLWEERVQKLAETGVLDQSVTSAFASHQTPVTTDDETEAGSIGRWQSRRTASLELDVRIPKLVETIALCHLSTAYILRQPVFLGDFLRWIETRQIPFTNAFDELPETMRERMDNYGLSRTRRKEAISPDWLQLRTLKLVMGYQKVLGLEVPPLNFSQCLFRLVVETAMPIEVYAATKVIAQVLELKFEYPKWQNPNGIRALPDRLLAACFVVAVSVLYPFDGRTRTPKSSSEPAAAVVDWRRWVEERKTLQANLERKGRPLRHFEGLETTEADALLMDESQVDKYLDWFEETFVSTRATMKAVIDPTKDAFTRDILEFFPLTGSKSQNHSSTKSKADVNEAYMTAVKATQANLIINKPSQDINVLRPGEATWIYRDALPEGTARTFYSEVSELIGTSVKSLHNAVLNIEDRLENWSAKLQRERTKLSSGSSQKQTRKRRLLGQ